MRLVKPAGLLGIISVSTLALAAPHEVIAKLTDPTVSKNALGKRANPTICSGIPATPKGAANSSPRPAQRAELSQMPIS